jgi:hypothetical protein
MMKRDAITLLVITTLLLILSEEAGAQSNDTPKFEVGAHFSSLSINQGETRTEPGFGGRFTFNVTDHLALEAEGDFFPRNSGFGSFRTGGRAAEGLFGFKVGKRYKRFGIFGKARSGLISFSEGLTEVFASTQTFTPDTVFSVRSQRLTHFATDLGGVLELYVSRRVFTRFDAGDTIIRYGQTTSTVFSGVPGGTFTPTRFTIPGDTTHNFQFNAGVGFRF